MIRPPLFVIETFTKYGIHDNILDPVITSKNVAGFQYLSVSEPR
jgi:hypothetical protein